MRERVEALGGPAGAGGEADPVVAHVQGRLAVHVGQGEGHPCRPRVPGHVGQRLLGDPQQGYLGVGAERPRRPGHGGGRGHAGLLGQLVGEPADRLPQRRRPQRRRPQVPDQPPGLGQVLAGRPPGPLQVPAGVLGALRQLPLGRLELQDDADEPLGEGVVDVAGQPLPLGQPAALPLGGRQLAAGRLQLLDQLPALVALLDDPGEPEREQGPEGHRHQAADDRRPVLGQRPARLQHLPPDHGHAERDRGRDRQRQAQVPEHLGGTGSAAAGRRRYGSRPARTRAAAARPGRPRRAAAAPG
jgi:hypothetical protein